MFNVGEKLDELRDLIDRKETLQKELSEINQKQDAIEYEVLQYMDTAGVESVKSIRISASKKVDLYPQVKDMDALVKWAAENGKAEILQRRVSGNVFKDYFTETGEYPDGVEAFQKTSLNFRRQK